MYAPLDFAFFMAFTPFPKAAPAGLRDAIGPARAGFPWCARPELWEPPETLLRSGRRACLCGRLERPFPVGETSVHSASLVGSWGARAGHSCGLRSCLL